MRNKAKHKRVETIDETMATDNGYWAERVNRKLKRAIRIKKNKRDHLKRLKPAFAFGLLALPLSMTVPHSAEAKLPLAINAETQTQTQTVTPPLAALATENKNIFADLADKVVPSVVNISTTVSPRRSEHPSAETFRREFDRFFGQGPGFFGYREDSQTQPHGKRYSPGLPRQNAQPQAMGTGVVIDMKKAAANYEGLVLTNYHVVADAGAIQIQFSKKNDSKSVEAYLVGKDEELDLALVKFESDVYVPALDFGDSQKLRVGDFVMAVGNPFGQGHSVSHGIISAKERNTPMILGKYLQTDAPINPGNSGGPLVDLNGNIIGINNAILANAQGIGFAIPSNQIMHVLAQLKKDGKVSRGYIGVQMGELNEQVAAFSSSTEIRPGSPYVVSVEPEGPASSAGIKPNDIIVSINEQKVLSPTDLLLAVTSLNVGETADVKVYRQGKIRTFHVKIKERPVS